MDAEQRIAESQRRIGWLESQVYEHRARLSALESARGQAGEGEAKQGDANCPHSKVFWKPKLSRYSVEAWVCETCGMGFQPRTKYDKIADDCDELERERDAAVRAEAKARDELSAVSDRLCGNANPPEKLYEYVDEWIDELTELRQIRDAAVRLKEALKEYDAGPRGAVMDEKRLEVMIAVRDLCALVGEEAKTCAHLFESNPGMYDTQHRYCAKCGVAE